MLEYEDFAALGLYLHELAQSTYHRMIVFIEQVKQLR
jgi:hypothetical protein